MRALRVPAMLLVAVLAVGCRRPDPIKVGLVAGLSGRHYDLGVGCRNGAQLAVEDVNAAGGVRGRPLELLVRDDAQEPETARRVVRELVSAGVVAIVGHCTSAMAAATLPIADESHVVMIAPTVSSGSLIGRDDWLILADASGTSTAEGLADYAVRTGLGRAVVAVSDRSNLAYAEPWRETFRAALEARGGRIASTVEFTSGQVGSFAELAERALASRPDAVLVIANAFDTAMLAQQLRKRVPDVPLLATGWSLTDDLTRHGGSAVEHALFVHKVNAADAGPRAVRFRSVYSERFSATPGFAAIEAYDSVRILAAALARDPTREGVRREILRLGRFEGLTEEFTIDRFGDAHRRNHISTVRGGRFQLVE